MKTNRIEIGTGYLNFNAVERRSDRYGAVRLFSGEDFNDNVPITSEEILSNEGNYGKLIAVITGTRKCEHMGDLFRGISPPKSPLPVGTEVELGAGELFVEQLGGSLHEKGQQEREDEEMMKSVMDDFSKMGFKEVKPEYGVVFILSDENGKYLMLMKFEENGNPDPNVSNISDEVFFEEKSSNLGENELDVVLIQESKLTSLARATAANYGGEDSTIHNMMMNHAESFVKLFRDAFEKIVVPHKNGATTEFEPEYHQVGLRPTDGSEKDWLDPRKVFQVLQQDVILYFEPINSNNTNATEGTNDNLNNPPKDE